MRNPFKRAGKKKTAATLQNDNRRETENTTMDMPEKCDTTTATQGKLLVMGQESAFSSEVMDYAIDMAQRMSFEILALNSAPLSCDSFSRFSTSRSKLCQEFQALSEESVTAFRDAAEANGIAFTHIVKYDEPDQALVGVQREYGNIEFVISDAQQPSTTDRVANNNRPRNEVLVYSMI
jgi:hypothetical protein